jgi:hypothetical protein
MLKKPDVHPLIWFLTWNEGKASVGVPDYGFKGLYTRQSNDKAGNMDNNIYMIGFNRNYLEKPFPLPNFINDKR